MKTCRNVLIALVCLLLLVPSISAQGMPALGEDAAIAFLPGKRWTLSPLKGLRSEQIVQLTGEDSPNRTQSRFGVWGTDLGSLAILNGKTYMFGGDTFADENNSHWRSNVLFIIEDDTPADGLDIVDAVTDRRGKAKELLGSQKVDHVEMTVIPTNLFAANCKLYCIYMSVSHWGLPGCWDARYSGLAVSEDGGYKWKKLPDVKWPGDSNFIQTANVLIGDTMYIWGIPSGRFGGVALMKVKENKLEDLSAYRYYTGLNEAGEPVWQAGEEGLRAARLVIEGPAGEISVIYNEHRGQFLISYLKEDTAAIVVREGITPWGPWSKPWPVATAGQYPALYGAYMHPEYVEDKGKSVYFAMSQFFPVYNIFWMRMDFPD